MRVKDDACASRVESYNWREPKKKRVHLNTHRVKKKKKKKKEIPKRRVTVTVGRSTGGARSKRVVSEFHKLHRNRPELRCNRVKSFETRNKIAARCDVTLNRGRGGRWLNLRTESSIGVERIGDGVPNLCAVTFTRWNPCVSLETAAAWNFSLFFSIFFPPFIHVGTAFTAIYRRPPPGRGGGSTYVHVRQARNATLGVRFRGRFHA